jgi:hypothetical protein
MCFVMSAHRRTSPNLGLSFPGLNPSINQVKKRSKVETTATAFVLATVTARMDRMAILLSQLTQ